MAELHGLRIYTNGELTIVTIEDKGYLASQTILGEATDHLEQIVEQQHTKVLLIDVSDIIALPSLMLGVLIALKHRGVEIRLFNVTEDVRLILEVMNLHDQFEIREGNLSSLIEEATEV